MSFIFSIVLALHTLLASIKILGRLTSFLVLPRRYRVLSLLIANYYLEKLICSNLIFVAAIEADQEVT